MPTKSRQMSQTSSSLVRRCSSPRWRISSHKCGPYGESTPLPSRMHCTMCRDTTSRLASSCFSGSAFDHEALEVLVEQVAAVTAATFRHENAAGRQGRRMELHGLHVAERNDAGIERDGRARAFIDRRVARVLAVDAAVATGRDDRGFGHDGKMRARPQAAHDRAKAATAVVNQRNGFGPITNRDTEAHDLAVDGIQRGVPGACGRVTRAPLGRTAEIALPDQSVVLERLVDIDFFTLDEIVVLAARARATTARRSAPVRAPRSALLRRKYWRLPGRRPSRNRARYRGSARSGLSPSALTQLASAACMPPCAAQLWLRRGGTSDRIIASWPAAAASMAQRSPASPPPITRTSVVTSRSS